VIFQENRNEFCFYRAGLSTDLPVRAQSMMVALGAGRRPLR
jgi:hypothetical protein